MGKTVVREQPDSEKLLTPAEVCERLHIGRRTLQKWIAAGNFPPGLRFNHKTVRWSKGVVDAFVAKVAAEKQPATVPA